MLRGVDNTPGGRRREDAYARFVELADSGGPGTSKGLLAAVEAATTVRRPALCMAVVTVMRRMPRGATSADAVTLLLERALHDLGFAVEGDR
jgi:hypothetical protein